MYVCPRNSWDLKSYQHEPNESLQDYFHRFSKQCNSLLDVIDADVISAFLSWTTYESLIHKLGCLKPHTTRDLLDITMNHAFGEEAIGEVFSGGRDKARPSVRTKTRAPPRKGARRTRRIGADRPTQLWSPQLIVRASSPSRASLTTSTTHG